MKPLISIALALLLPLGAMATGAVGTDPAQNGVITYDNVTWAATNTFSFPFSTIPIVLFYPSSATAFPYTNTVSKTGFELDLNSVTASNLTVSWSAYVGTPRIEYGQVTSTTHPLQTNTFSPTYAFTPNLVICPVANKTNAVYISSVTSSNFVLDYGVTVVGETVNFQAIGTAFQPGNNPVSN